MHTIKFQITKRRALVIKIKGNDVTIELTKTKRRGRR